MNRPFPLLLAVAALFFFSGCATAPTSESGKADKVADANKTIADAQRNDPSLKKFFDEAAGYAVFPTVGKGAIGVGGAYGKGILYQNAKTVGFCDLSQATIGFQLGGQAYSEIIFFETPAALDHFKSGNFAFSAQATAVALKSGSGANAKYSSGVAVFTLGEAGLMYEASIGGQKFSYKPQ
ncbi:MAG: lipid-binding SYLF domain-containing protein [Planctomycetota bacterium]|nr:lipid-binding SYLF domain-containing protein [Planctomycetota bacterium]